jgi:hypothetical protein
MLGIQTSCFSPEITYYFTVGAHRQSLQKDILFARTFHFGVPGHGFVNVLTEALNVVESNLVNLRNFCKADFQEVQINKNE